MQTPKQAIKEFEEMLEMAELKALSALSLERQLTSKEFERLMRLKKEVLGGD